MQTLKELVDFLTPLGYDDIHIISAYLSQDEVVSEAPKVLTDMMQEKLNKLVYYKNSVNVMAYPADYYRNYDNETAHLLDTVTRKIQLGYLITIKEQERLKNVDLNINYKGAFWNTTAELIRSLQDEKYIPKYSTKQPILE